VRAPLVDEWVEKAEADYLAALALNRRRSRPLPDVVCYQSTEKYFKAYLLHNGSLRRGFMIYRFCWICAPCTIGGYYG
jgi:hypothetical protein